MAQNTLVERWFNQKVKQERLERMRMQMYRPNQLPRIKVMDPKKCIIGTGQRWENCRHYKGTERLYNMDDSEMQYLGECKFYTDTICIRRKPKNKKATIWWLEDVDKI